MQQLKFSRVEFFSAMNNESVNNEKNSTLNLYFQSHINKYIIIKINFDFNYQKFYTLSLFFIIFIKVIDNFYNMIKINVLFFKNKLLLFLYYYYCFYFYIHRSSSSLIKLFCFKFEKPVITLAQYTKIVNELHR